MRRGSFITCCTMALAGSCFSSFAVEGRKPNVVIIYGDDVGYGDVGVYGSKMIPTPNIDAFARESLIFTDGHCTAATCSPSRFAMLTGVHAFRHGVRILGPTARLAVPTDKITLPRVFQQAGYKTGIIGKWHLGFGEPGKPPVNWNKAIKPGPLEVGFDYAFLLPHTNDRVPCVYVENHHVVNLDPDDPISIGRERVYPNSTEYPCGRENPEAMTYYPSSHGHNNSVINGIGRIGYMWGGKSALWNDETMADEFVDRMKTFVAENKDEPFFLFFSSQDIHAPRTPHPRFQGESELGYRGDAMVQFDWSTGQILKTLEEHGLRENTIVIFSSDNGPVYDDGYQDGTVPLCSSAPSDRGHYGAGPYRGGKYQIYEGGHRVPFIVGWPGVIEPGWSDALVTQVDFLASFASLLGVDIPEGEARDSQDTMKAFLGRDKVGRKHIITESFGLALRDGNWKYIEPSRPRWWGGREPIPESLYNLEDDIAEKENIVEKYPERVAAMREKLNRLKSGKPSN